jgi:hypothetical protein
MQRGSVRIDLMLAAGIYIIGIIGVLKIGPARPKNRSSRQIGGESPEVVGAARRGADRDDRMPAVSMPGRNLSGYAFVSWKRSDDVVH